MFKENARILFQGDSITHGGRSNDNDRNHNMGHGYPQMLAGRIGADFPNKNYSFFNRGISGNKSVDLYARIKEDIIDINPDVLSLLIGVNDILFKFNNNSKTPANEYEKTYNQIIHQTKLKFPNIKLILCEPFSLPVGNVLLNWKAWKEELEISRQVVKKIAKLNNAIFVPLQIEFDLACTKANAEYWIWDGVHPTPAGHELIVRAWLKALN